MKIFAYINPQLFADEGAAGGEGAGPPDVGNVRDERSLLPVRR